MPTKGTTRHAIRIPDELWHAALTKAQGRGDKLSEIIRQALKDYVETEDDTRATKLLNSPKS